MGLQAHETGRGIQAASAAGLLPFRIHQLRNRLISAGVLSLSLPRWQLKLGAQTDGEPVKRFGDFSFQEICPS